MVYTENGTRIEEGTILKNMLLKQSNKNPEDGIAWEDKFAIIVKDAQMNTGATRMVDLRIDRVSDRYAFATVI